MTERLEGKYEQNDFGLTECTELHVMTFKQYEAVKTNEIQSGELHSCNEIPVLDVRS